MKGIINTAVILGLGIAPSVALAEGNSTQAGAQAESGTGQSGSQRPQSETMPKDAQGGKTIGAGGPPATEPGTQEEGGSSGVNGKQTPPGAGGASQQEGRGSAGGQSGQDMNQGSPRTQQGQSTGKAAKPEGGVSGEAAGNVDVTTQQRTEMRQIIAEEKVEPVASTDIDVSIGTAVPGTVEIHALPPRIVKLVPAFEGYKYFVLADGRIVIVDPNSLEIVDIITA